MHNYYVSGKHVYLRHPSEEDARGKWHEWLSDPEVTRFLGHQYWPNSIENQIGFYKSLLGDKSRLVLAVVDKETDQHIGICSLSSIDWVHRYCDIAFLIGEQQFRKGPNAFEAVSLMLQVAFHKLNMRKIKASHAGNNAYTETLLQVFGFKLIGRVEELLWIDGAYEDVVYSVLDRKDWLKKC